MRFALIAVAFAVLSMGVAAGGEKDSKHAPTPTPTPPTPPPPPHPPIHHDRKKDHKDDKHQDDKHQDDKHKPKPKPDPKPEPKPKPTPGPDPLPPTACDNYCAGDPFCTSEWGEKARVCYVTCFGEMTSVQIDQQDCF